MKMNMRTYKVVVVGDTGVGKSSYIDRRAGIDLPTVGVEVHPVVFVEQSVCLNTWDISGAEHSSGLRHGYYVGANAVIAMFDLSNRDSLTNVTGWINEVLDVVGNVPVVVVGNRRDNMTDVCSDEEIKAVCGEYKYYITSLSNRNTEPMTYIINMLE